MELESISKSFDTQVSAPEKESLYTSLLQEINQTHILTKLNTVSLKERENFFKQLYALDQSCIGGLKGYYQRARSLLQDLVQHKNPFANCKVISPPIQKLEFGNSTYVDFEKIGCKELENTAFVLVAGGLGERLGYPGIKLEIPIDIITHNSFLGYYIEYILAFEKRFGNGKRIPLLIMTSDDTHQRTKDLLAEHEYYGMKSDQVTLLKQEKVPALLNSDCHFAVSEKDFQIETKPHGHGDVHTLLYQSGMERKWFEQGKKWIVFFQDTNPLVFRCLPAILGVSKAKNLEMNSLVVPRKSGEAVGAVCTLKNDEKELTVNVEYNILENLFGSMGGEPKEDDGYSKLPGNTNFLIFNLVDYNKTLHQNKGVMSEFINPKFTDDTKTQFKSPARLECLMQDYPKLLPNSKRVGLTQLDRDFCFSTCKYSLDAGEKLQAKGLHPETASTCEWDFYNQNAQVLRACGMEIQQSHEEKVFKNIFLRGGPQVVLFPEFGVTYEEIKNKIKGECFMTENSCLVLDGDIQINNFRLDGSVWIKGDGNLNNYHNKEKNYINFVELDDIMTYQPYVLIRGYTTKNLAEISQVDVI
jgi:UDP-sugar pyrophosphorylase